MHQYGSVLVAFVLAFVSSFQAHGKVADPRYEKRANRGDVDFTVPVTAKEIKIMSYNLANLFDTTPDEGKSDWEFLPIKHPLKKNCISQGPYRKSCEETDWTPERLRLKLKQIRRVVEAQGSLPDMMGVVEVENEKVLKMLADELGYSTYVITESPDARGIDVALMFNEDKVKYVSHVEREVTGKYLKTRNLLGVNFSIKGFTGETLGVYVNHWPSQGKNSESRMTVARALKTLVDEQTATRRTKYNVVLLGDFNTIDSDRPHPFHEVITNSAWKQNFYCVQTLFDGLKLPEKRQMPPGTYFYYTDGSWNKLDRFFVNQNLVDQTGLELVPESFRIVAPEFATKAYEYGASAHHLFSSVVFGVPKAYDHNTSDPEQAGFSDHFSIVMKLRVN